MKILVWSQWHLSLPSRLLCLAVSLRLRKGTGLWSLCCLVRIVLLYYCLGKSARMVVEVWSCYSRVSGACSPSGKQSRGFDHVTHQVKAVQFSYSFAKGYRRKQPCLQSVYERVQCWVSLGLLLHHLPPRCFHADKRGWKVRLTFCNTQALACRCNLQGAQWSPRVPTDARSFDSVC